MIPQSFKDVCTLAAYGPNLADQSVLFDSDGSATFVEVLYKVPTFLPLYQKMWLPWACILMEQQEAKVPR